MLYIIVVRVDYYSLLLYSGRGKLTEKRYFLDNVKNIYYRMVFML